MPQGLSACPQRPTRPSPAGGQHKGDWPPASARTSARPRNARPSAANSASSARRRSNRSSTPYLGILGAREPQCRLRREAPRGHRYLAAGCVIIHGGTSVISGPALATVPSHRPGAGLGAAGAEDQRGGEQCGGDDGPSTSMACCQPSRAYRRHGCGRAVGPGAGSAGRGAGGGRLAARAAPGSSRGPASPRRRPAG